MEYPTIRYELNSLPFTVITPRYPALPADAIVDARVSQIALYFSKSYERILLKAVNALAEYDREKARKFAIEAVKQNEGFAEAHLLLGILDAEVQSFSSAIEHLENAKKERENCGLLLRRLAPTLRLMLRVSRFHFFPLYPDFYGCSLVLMACYAGLGKINEAERIYDELSKLFKPRDEMRAVMAEAYIALGDYEKALRVLEREKAVSVDELDSTINILNAIALLELGRRHDALLCLHQEIRCAEGKNPYLCAIAGFLYTTALEQDGLILLTLQELRGIEKRYVLNPTIRKYLEWKQESLKQKLSQMSIEEVYESGRLSWTERGISTAEEKRRVEDALKKLMPEYWRAFIAKQEAPERLKESEMNVQRRFFRISPKATEEEKVPARESQKQAETAEHKDMQIPFEAGKTYKWSISTEGEGEFLKLDFRGIREAPRYLLSGEKFVRKLQEYGAIVALAILFVFILRRCF